MLANLKPFRVMMCLGNERSSVSIRQTFHLYVQLNLAILQIITASLKNSESKYILFPQIHISFTRRGTTLLIQFAKLNFQCLPIQLES
jgi:hypothetical protein